MFMLVLYNRGKLWDIMDHHAIYWGKRKDSYRYEEQPIDEIEAFIKTPIEKLCIRIANNMRLPWYDMSRRYAFVSVYLAWVPYMFIRFDRGLKTDTIKRLSAPMQHLLAPMLIS